MSSSGPSSSDTRISDAVVDAAIDGRGCDCGAGDFNALLAERDELRAEVERLTDELAKTADALSESLAQTRAAVHAAERFMSDDSCNARAEAAEAALAAAEKRVREIVNAPYTMHPVLGDALLDLIDDYLTPAAAVSGRVELEPTTKDGTVNETVELDVPDVRPSAGGVDAEAAAALIRDMYRRYRDRGGSADLSTEHGLHRVTFISPFDRLARRVSVWVAVGPEDSGLTVRHYVLHPYTVARNMPDGPEVENVYGVLSGEFLDDLIPPGPVSEYPDVKDSNDE